MPEVGDMVCIIANPTQVAVGSVGTVKNVVGDLALVVLESPIKTVDKTTIGAVLAYDWEMVLA